MNYNTMLVNTETSKYTPKFACNTNPISALKKVKTCWEIFCCQVSVCLLQQDISLSKYLFFSA